VRRFRIRASGFGQWQRMAALDYRVKKKISALAVFTAFSFSPWPVIA
jgi:hypothetical protein